MAADILKQLETLKAQKARFEGQREQIMKQLKELGHDTVESAQAEIDELNEFITTTEPSLEEQYAQFVATYGHVLEGR